MALQHLAGETSLLWLTQGPTMLLGLITQEGTLWSNPTNLIHGGVVTAVAAPKGSVILG